MPLVPAYGDKESMRDTQTDVLGDAIAQAPRAHGVFRPAQPTGVTAQSASPARVLLIADDRRFRAAAATLLSQRGYAVAVGRRGEDVIELALREHPDVVLLDASWSLTAAAREVARLGALRPRVGIVAVSAAPASGLAALPVLPKWGSFDEVFEAIERASCAARSGGVAHAAR